MTFNCVAFDGKLFESLFADDDDDDVIIRVGDIDAFLPPIGRCAADDDNFPNKTDVICFNGDFDGDFDGDLLVLIYGAPTDCVNEDTGDGDDVTASEGVRFAERVM